MAEKVTTMVLKVDLQCPRCYKKIKKILCKFPQIRDQIYDDKQNTVTIIVVSCSPEKFRDKLCCKGGKTIECIEIKETPKPKPTPTPTPTPKPTPTPTPTPKPTPTPTPTPKPTPATPQQTPAPVPKKPLCPAPILVAVCPPIYPVGICCRQCNVGRNDGPCNQGCRRPVPCYDNYGCGPYCYGGNRGCYTSLCDYYSEENTSGCIIM